MSNLVRSHVNGMTASPLDGPVIPGGTGHDEAPLVDLATIAPTRHAFLDEGAPHCHPTTE